MALDRDITISWANESLPYSASSIQLRHGRNVPVLATSDSRSATPASRICRSARAVAAPHPPLQGGAIWNWCPPRDVLQIGQPNTSRRTALGAPANIPRAAANSTGEWAGLARLTTWTRSPRSSTRPGRLWPAPGAAARSERTRSDGENRRVVCGRFLRLESTDHLLVTLNHMVHVGTVELTLAHRFQLIHLLLGCRAWPIRNLHAIESCNRIELAFQLRMVERHEAAESFYGI
jgi:hypothetical protein